MSRMTTLGALFCAVVAGAALNLAAGSARAASVGPVTVAIPTGDVGIDEAGDGLWGATQLQYAITNDTNVGGLTNVLTYTLPFTVQTNGDLILDEPGTQTVSDVIRFVGNQVFFYSDLPAESGEFADIGLPTGYLTNSARFTEIGAEGELNGINYTPAAGDPGYAPGNVVTYHIISDYAPEPASLSLLALGGVALLARRRRS